VAAWSNTVMSLFVLFLVFVVMAFADGNDRSLKKAKQSGERKRFDSDFLSF
jgi:hypothetical protein